MTALVCNHGFWQSHCKLCAPLPGECDYGNCTEQGTEMVDYIYNGRRTETRRACARHAVSMETQTGYAQRRPMSSEAIA